MPIHPHPVPSATSPRPETPYVYDLRKSGEGSDDFYTALELFADRTLSTIECRADPLLDGYARHIQSFLEELPRSRGEYALDFLILGMILDRYEAAANNMPRWAAGLARGLLWVRGHSQTAKPAADWIRAGLNRYVFSTHVGGKLSMHGTVADRLDRVIDWTEASGEFQHESKRLQNWRSYLTGLKSEKATAWLRVAVDLFHAFARDAENELGAFTRGVHPFVSRQRAHPRWREDLLMRERSEVEYHLNMLAAEVMNRGLRESFLKAPGRVVLVPGCLRGERSSQCKARIDGVDMTCAGCDPECAVNRITLKFRAEGMKVYIVPHSSGFSRWLSRWQNTETAVIAVACVLNLLPGGLEMRERRIPSQCLPLDFPGCRKHWDPVGIPTAVNEPRLLHIATSLQRG